MPVIYRTHVRISRIRPPLPRRVRHHHLRFLPYLLIRLAQRNRIPITLRHLPPIQPRYPWRMRQHRLRLAKDMEWLNEIGIPTIEFRKEIAVPNLRGVLPDSSLPSNNLYFNMNP